MRRTVANANWEGGLQDLSLTKDESKSVSGIGRVTVGPRRPGFRLGV